MSHSSIAEQVEELRKAGVPVKIGVPAFRSENNGGASGDIASGLWLHRWAKHACQNYERVHRAKGVRFLADACRGVPAYVIGIGPSLDDVLPELKQVEGRAVVISTDAAVKPLLANQIKPDLVVSFDCKAEQKTLWETIPEHGIACLFDTCAHPDAIQSWKGPVMFYNHWHQQDEFSAKLLPYIFPHVGQIPSLGTVGNMAIMVARLMGCDPIITVGMDFCYRKNGEGWIYRAKDYSIKDGAWQEHENRLLYDNDERVKRSFEVKMGEKSYRVDKELDIYHGAIVHAAKQYTVNLINIAAGSRLADTFPTQPFFDTVKTYAASPLNGGRHVLPYLNHIIGRDH